MFVPSSRDHILLDVDLKGADAQVVAWEADDEDLKSAFKAGLNIHHKNGCDMWEDAFEKLPQETYEYKRSYKQIKVGVHATNYIGSAKTLAVSLGWTIGFSEQFQAKWFRLHPKIRHWHQRIEREIAVDRRVRNAFGFHRVYFGRIEGVLPQGLAWIPQSTIALTCNRGLIKVRKQLDWVNVFMQTHDSGLLEIPKSRLSDILQIRDLLHNPIPYPDPLTVPWELKLSDKSYGDCKPYEWEDAATLRY